MTSENNIGPVQYPGYTPPQPGLPGYVPQQKVVQPSPPRKKRLGYLWLLVLLVIAALLIGFYFIGPTESVPVAGPVLSLDEVVATGNTELCLDLTEDIDCVTQIALERTDSSVCDILDAGGRDYCLYTFVSKYGTIADCAALVNESLYEFSADSCRAVFTAYALGDCGGFEDADGYGSIGHCLSVQARYSGNESLCQDIYSANTQFTQDICYFDVAVTFRRPDLCGFIVEASPTNSRNYCLMTIARETSSAALCNSLSEDVNVLYNRQQCLEAIQ